ncbi:MAG: adenosylmethionine decarboxylase [Thermoplasmata archaeon]|nr:S-adenosylmethionine decarboxylase [Thermoplasmatales archaeon]PMP75179.1 MAG: S-adenosylmethionine decarboxylase [Aciduliprofundum sp.]
MKMAVGIHIIADFYGVDKEKITYVEQMKPIFEETVRYAGLTKISSDYYQFRPKGCSGVVLIAESHLSFHTWPEHELITLDIYTCGDPKQAYLALEYLERTLRPKKISQMVIERGTDVQEDNFNLDTIRAVNY